MELVWPLRSQKPWEVLSFSQLAWSWTQRALGEGELATKWLTQTLLCLRYWPLNISLLFQRSALTDLIWPAFAFRAGFWYKAMVERLVLSRLLPGKQFVGQWNWMCSCGVVVKLVLGLRHMKLVFGPHAAWRLDCCKQDSLCSRQHEVLYN